MIAATTIDLPSIPSEVLDLAMRNGLASCLRPLFTAARDVFRGCPITLRLERDAEIESEQHIVIEVDVSGCSVDDMFEARNRWSQQFCDLCPAENSVIFQIRLVQNS
jgi:hypothetical protein